MSPGSVSWTDELPSHLYLLSLLCLLPHGHTYITTLRFETWFFPFFPCIPMWDGRTPLTDSGALQPATTLLPSQELLPFPSLPSFLPSGTLYHLQTWEFYLEVSGKFGQVLDYYYYYFFPSTCCFPVMDNALNLPSLPLIFLDFPLPVSSFYHSTRTSLPTLFVLDGLEGRAWCVALHVLEDHATCTVLVPTFPCLLEQAIHATHSFLQGVDSYLQFTFYSLGSGRAPQLWTTLPHSFPLTLVQTDEFPELCVFTYLPVCSLLYACILGSPHYTYAQPLPKPPTCPYHRLLITTDYTFDSVPRHWFPIPG